MMLPYHKSFLSRGVLISSLIAFGMSLALLLAPSQSVIHHHDSSFLSQAGQSLYMKPASAQRLSVSDIAQQVYASFPLLPLENDYIDRETGEVDVDNTLVSRFIRYHLYVARRQPIYRLDWKISLADYLGVNDWIREEQYPGASDLRTNPINMDLDAMRQLNRAERDALVEELVAVFSSQGDRLPTYLSR